MKYRNAAALVLAGVLSVSLAACGSSATAETAADPAAVAGFGSAAQQTIDQAFQGKGTVAAETASYETVETAENQWFTQRDLTQTPDLSQAVTCAAEDGKDITITAAGVYVLTGTAENVTVVVDAGDEDKVQLVLDGLTLTNEDAPAIYVKNADKVFLTTTDSDNTLTVTGAFSADGEDNTDAVIFSKDDLVLNGLGTLTVISPENGVSAKDDLKITGGTLVIDCQADALEAHDAIAVAGGEITVTAGKDGLHAGDSDDDTVGAVYVSGGTLTILAEDDAIQAATAVQIDGGDFDLTASEGIEGTFVQINGGVIVIDASDDGVNAAQKSSALDPALEITGGTLTITMGEGDTDAIDVNGDLTISGGTVTITARSPFDYDGAGTLTGGTVTVNGETVTQLTGQMMGGGMGGGQMGGLPFGGGRWSEEGTQPDGQWSQDGTQSDGGWSQEGIQPRNRRSQEEDQPAWDRWSEDTQPPAWDRWEEDLPDWEADPEDGDQPDWDRWSEDRGMLDDTRPHGGGWGGEESFSSAIL